LPDTSMTYSVQQSAAKLDVSPDMVSQRVAAREWPCTRTARRHPPAPAAVPPDRPALSHGGIANGGGYTLGAAPAPTCAATDATSCLAGACTGSLSGGTPKGAGSFTYFATATDRAGNLGTAIATYQVR
jgi:hypothetical protein